MINQQFQDKGKDMWKFYVFSIIGIILFFIPIIYIFPIDDKPLLAKASMISIIEMFLPSLLVVKAAIEVKFVVAITSISAIIFFSALIPCILATDIKIPIWKLVVIWFIRVALTLLIAIPLSLLIF